MQTNFEEVLVLVHVEVVGLKKFLGYVNDRGVNPDMIHYSVIILNLTCGFNSTYSFCEIPVSFYKSTLKSGCSCRNGIFSKIQVSLDWLSELVPVSNFYFPSTPFFKLSSNDILLSVISYKVKHHLTSYLEVFCLQGCTSEEMKRGGFHGMLPISVEELVASLSDA